MPKNLFKNITLLSLFALTRLVNLSAFPPFVDELLYFRWVKTITSFPSQFMLPVIEDGQPPLYLWLGSLISQVTHLDPVLILRLISILFGAATLYLIVRLGTLIHSRRLGYILGILYILFPMFLWYDRLAMSESMITFAGLLNIIGLYLRFYHHSILIGTKLILTGLLLGLLTKATALLFVPIIISCYFYNYYKKKLVRTDYFLLATITLILLGILFYAQSIVVKGSSFLLSPQVILSHLYSNMYSTIQWLVGYSTLPLIFLYCFGIYKLYFYNKSLAIWSTYFLGLIIGIEIVIAKIYFPRYFLWVMPLYLFPIGWGILELSKSKLGKLFVVICLIPLLRFDYLLITNPIMAPFPAIERWQYISGWPSGYGISSITELVKNNPSDYLVVEKNEACRTGLSYYGFVLPKLIEFEDDKAIKSALSSGYKANLCQSQQYPKKGMVVTNIGEVSRPGGESSLRLNNLVSYE